MAGANASALGPSLATNSDIYHTRRETQCTAVCTNNAVPVN